LQGTGCFSPDEQSSTTLQNQELEEHAHNEAEVHDEHDHDLHDHGETDHDDDHVKSGGHAQEHADSKSDVHDEDDHDLNDHDEAGEGEEHPESDDHAEEGLIHLSESEMKNMGIELAQAAPGTIEIELNVPGEIRLNADHKVNIVSRLTGIVKEVTKSVGDSVLTGETMAIIESRELADARSSLHAAHDRFELAALNFKREERLWEKKISSEQDYLNAKQELSEARIELESAKQKLLTLGFSNSYVETLPHDPKEVLTDLKVTAPFSGKVIERNITLGELLQEDTVAFVVADLNTVWVDLSIYQKDLPFVHEGQSISITAGRGIPDAKGIITYLSPVISEETRTALARVILPNPEGHFRPGLFVTASLAGEEIPVSLLVPKSALQNLEGKTSIFIQHQGDFKQQPVTIGKTTKTHAEVTSGLKAGQYYVTQGAFELKAKIVTSTMDSHAGHGH
jgi:cobalt-zinc-cadmium efflux system membrane fusion protein